MPDASPLFRRHFGTPPVYQLRAPLGLALLGRHADYCQGLAVTVAVDRSLHLAVSPRTDGRVQVVRDGLAEPERFWVSELRSNPSATWADGLKGVLDQLRRRRVNFSGFNAAIQCDELIRPDASSSLAVATALAVRQLYPFSLTEAGAALPPRRNPKNELPPLGPAEKWHIAALCGAAAAGPETHAAGASTNPRKLQAAAALFGKAWHAASMDLKLQSVEYASIVGTAIVLCQPDPSNISSEIAALSTSSQPDLGRLCQTAAPKLGVRSLRSVELKTLDASKSKLTDYEYAGARHLLADTARVVAAERALREADLPQFGQYLFQSHASARQALPVSPPSELLVELARMQTGCLGACLAGDNGATLNLVAHHQAPDFAAQMTQNFKRRTGGALRAIICQAVDHG